MVPIIPIGDTRVLDTAPYNKCPHTHPLIPNGKGKKINTAIRVDILEGLRSILADPKTGGTDLEYAAGEDGKCHSPSSLGVPHLPLDDGRLTIGELAWTHKERETLEERDTEGALTEGPNAKKAGEHHHPPAVEGGMVGFFISYTAA